MKRTEEGITLTYSLVQKIEQYKTTQEEYNKEFSKQLNDLHKLVNELKSNTDSKLDIIINSNSKNKDLVLEKLEILNQSFDKISDAYKPDGTPSKQPKFEGYKGHINDNKK